LIIFFFFLISLSFALQVELKSNYPLKKNNLFKILNEKNYERILEMLKVIPEIKSVKYKKERNKLTVYVERYPIIKEIKIKGNVYLRDEDVKNVLGIEEGVPLIEKSPEVFEEILKKYYQEKGFLNASVKVKIKVNKKGLAKIYVDIHEGNLYFLGEPIFKGGEKVKREELLKASGLVVGSVFNVDKVEDGEENLENFYREKGFFESFVYLKGIKKEKLKKRFKEALFPKTHSFLKSLSIGLKNLVNHPIATVKALIGSGKLGIPVYEIYEGSRYDFTFEGNKFFSDSHLYSLFDINTVGIDILALESFKGKIEKEYKKKGFLDVRVDYELKNHTVIVKINEGKRYKARIFLNGKKIEFPYDEEKIKTLVQKEMDYLKKLGYVTASYEIKKEIDKEKKIIKVYVKIAKGLQYIVWSFKVENGMFRDLNEKLSRKFPMVLNYETLNEIYTQINKRLKEKGYFDAQVFTEVSMQKVKDAILLFYVVKVIPGKRYEYGDTLIYGLKKTRMKEAQYVLEKNKYFSKELEERSVWNAMESGIFRSLRLEDYIDRKNKKVHRLAYFQEKKRGVLGISAGFNTFEGFKFWAELTLRNLFGIGLINTNTFSISEKYQLYRISFKDNFLFSSKLLGEGTLFKDYEQHDTYELFTKGYSLSLGYRFAPLTFLGISFSQFNAKTTGSEEDKGNYKKLGLSFSLKEKFRIGLFRAYGHRNYSKFEFEGKVKKEFFEKLGLRLKLSYGYVSKKAPIFDRFFLGGYRRMKGYTFESIGAPFGKRQMLYLSPEIYYLLNKNLELITFLELGKVADKFPSLYKDVKKDVGFSAGLRTPVGLIRGDIAYPLEDLKLKPSRLKFYVSVDFYF